MNMVRGAIYVFNPAITQTMVDDDPYLSTTPDLWIEVAEMIGMDPNDYALYAECAPHIIVFEA